MMTMRGSGRSAEVAVELHRSSRAEEVICLANILRIVQNMDHFPHLFGILSPFIFNTK